MIKKNLLIPISICLTLLGTVNSFAQISLDILAEV